MTERIEKFLIRWKKAGGSERANYQLFLTELCSVLELPSPDPANEETCDNAYVFERRVIINHPTGETSNGFIDLYRRGSFVLEAKQTGKSLDSDGWDKAMLRAVNQADQYARALPAEEGRPPFILVVDVGRNIELYSEFTRSGATYTPFPDPRSHRIRLDDLRDEAIRERLRAVWLDPLDLDPARHSARVTREIADQLAKLAKSLEASGRTPEMVAGFLMRALFTMFAEDIGLLPSRGFTDLLCRLRKKPAAFAPMLENLWRTMNSGGFSPVLETTLLRFNGGLFAEPDAIPLDGNQMDLLLKASEADWQYVEPAIFGTLLERALDPRERHKLGAHYTPRAYVERLVLPTVIEPLRAQWKEVQVAVAAFQAKRKQKEAISEIRAFHRHLCAVRVLDPACGSGNFLYVTLEHMKRLEGEVLNTLHDFGESQGLLELAGITVDPHQFLGLEVNPRAAKIAEMVLWIGYLQWHYKSHGNVNPPEPVLRDFHNIEFRDALIAYDEIETLTDVSGSAITRWDGRSTKISEITGEEIPDESARVPQFHYRNPRKVEWPQADYIVGNPPFIGNKRMRSALGNGYVDAVRNTWGEVPESSDFVMYWWHIAAKRVQSRRTQQFGFITTNSISQTFNRRVVQQSLDAKDQMSLTFAIPDHPWVDASDGAAVRIAMTVGGGGSQEGRLLKAINESSNGSEEIDVQFTETHGKIKADLAIDGTIANSTVLRSNLGLALRGVTLVGQGFVVTEDHATQLDNGALLKQYRNGKDLTDKARNVLVIDAYGLTEQDLKEQYPATWQWLHDRVKPEREHNSRASYRENWWIFAEPRSEWRLASRSLKRYVVTPMTAKHRLFLFASIDTLPDQGLVPIATDDAFILGVLSSRIHVLWSLIQGGTLEDRPRYNQSRCFDTFPFPQASREEREAIRDIAERLDEHRKRQLALHPDLGLTAMYNVLERMRQGELLNAKEKIVHQDGILSLLRKLHDELDELVLAAYGWSDLATELFGLPGATTPLKEKSKMQAEAETELLRRLTSLNGERSAGEAQGEIHWLRSDYRAGDAVTGGQSIDLDLPSTEVDEAEKVASIAASRQVWPKQMRDQVAVVLQNLSNGPLDANAIAVKFKRSPKMQVQDVLDALVELGMVQMQSSAYCLAFQRPRAA